MEAIATIELALDIDLTIDIKAKRERVFEGIIDQMTHLSTDDKGGKLKFQLERWPGGRWYRDLGDNKGHLWGFVQSYRRHRTCSSSLVPRACPIRLPDTSSFALRKRGREPA